MQPYSLICCAATLRLHNGLVCFAVMSTVRVNSRYSWNPFRYNHPGSRHLWLWNRIGHPNERLALHSILVYGGRPLSDAKSSIGPRKRWTLLKLLLLLPLFRRLHYLFHINFPIINEINDQFDIIVIAIFHYEHGVTVQVGIGEHIIEISTVRTEHHAMGAYCPTALTGQRYIAKSFATM